MSFLAKQDPNIKAVIDQELMRQRDKLEMIASEKYRIPSRYGSSR